MTTLLSDSGNDSTTPEPVMNRTEPPRQSLQSFPLYTALQYVVLIYPPTIFVFGMFGNVMTIIIMRRLTAGNSVIHIYFTAIAVFDAVFLCTSLIPWLGRWLGFSITGSHSVVCKIYTWLYTGSGTISCWILVCMTVHRAMSVVWPHRVNVLCTRRTVLLVLTGITVFFALLYSHYMIGYDRVYMSRIRKYMCSATYINETYRHFYENVFKYIELSVYCMLPFAFLAVSNSVLVWKLSASVKAATRKFTHSDSQQVQTRGKAANSVTLTVLTLSLVYVVLTLPAAVTFILLYSVLDRVSGYEYVIRAFVSDVSELLGVSNNAVNFYLYILTGRRFREEFLKVICCRRKGRRLSLLRTAHHQ